MFHVHVDIAQSSKWLSEEKYEPVLINESIRFSYTLAYPKLKLVEFQIAFVAQDLHYASLFPPKVY